MNYFQEEIIKEEIHARSFGGDLFKLNNESMLKDEVFQRIGDRLDSMHTNERSNYGKVSQNKTSLEKCYQLQLINAKINLDYACENIKKIEESRSKLLDKLYELESMIKPRSCYSFIHGELGPDHIIVNDKLEPYLIDIEGADFLILNFINSITIYHSQQVDYSWFTEGFQTKNSQKVLPNIIPVVL